ncbi:MAG: 23S rRNA (pseudouridine(1915)-N(3))-methyltransferase RlmH [Oscillospiraceae bacterium]|nr:23S rRNA (pseudouridine(1915)-N(3))-methyltransferase RlmH [Oscillospiraceae bacterium]
MLRVQLICVGRLKESWYAAACDEYAKRLSRYCQLERAELPETGDMERDGEAVLRRLAPDTFAAAMCVEGELCSSEELAARLADCANRGRSRVAFIIGGSDGLSNAVKARADARISMSRMTFPHHLARVMVLEQLYRAFTINEGGKYHK